MHKRILLIILAVVIVFGLGGCLKKEVENQLTNTSVPDTGKIIDITEKNKQVIAAVPGDAILITLKTKKNEDWQWSFREPIAGEYLSLKRHDIITEGDTRVLEDEMISEWKFKIEKAGEFNIRFNLEESTETKNPKEVFLVKIISDKNKKELENILVDEPLDKQDFTGPLKVAGFARVFEGTVNYRLKDSEGKVLAEGFATAKQGAPEFGYFEAEIKTGQVEGLLTLEVFQISAQDGAEIDKVVRTLE